MNVDGIMYGITKVKYKESPVTYNWYLLHNISPMHKVNAGDIQRLKCLMWRIMRNDAIISGYLHIKTQKKENEKKNLPLAIWA